jgi:hypothetical protein
MMLHFQRIEISAQRAGIATAQGIALGKLSLKNAACRGCNSMIMPTQGDALVLTQILTKFLMQ